MFTYTYVYNLLVYPEEMNYILFCLIRWGTCILRKFLVAFNEISSIFIKAAFIIIYINLCDLVYYAIMASNGIKVHHL